MPQSCLPSALGTAAKCFRCLTPRQLREIKTYLLCNYPTIPAPLTIDILDTSVINNLTISWTQSEVPDNNEVWVDRGGGYALFATVPGATTTQVDATAMGAGAIWYYKVRAIKGGNAGPFSAQVGAIREYNFNGSPVTTLGLPDVVIGFGNVFATLCPNLTSFSWPKLHTMKNVGAADGFGCNQCANLVTFSAPLLRTCRTMSVFSDAKVAIVSMPSLTAVNYLSIQSDNSLTTISLPLLTAAPLQVDINTNPVLTSVSMPVFATTAGAFNVTSNASITTLSFPSLASVGTNLTFFGNSSLTSIDFPILASVGSTMDFNTCVSLTSLSVPSLVSIGLDLAGYSCQSIVTMDFSTVTSLGSGIDVSLSTNLANFDINAPFVDTGIGLLLNDCNLTDVSVNKILAMGVAGATTTNDYELGGGTNAAPTGQGILDKATLIGAGNTVVTN